MKHEPTLLDVCADLKRTIYASLTQNGFDDPECKYFLKKSLENLDKTLNDIPSHKREVQIARDRISRNEPDNHKKRENLLLAATLLQYC